MEFALGVLHWPPDQFWRATFYELSCAYIGHCRANGMGKWARREDGWTRAEIEEQSERDRRMRESGAEKTVSKKITKAFKAAWNAWKKEQENLGRNH